MSDAVVSGDPLAIRFKRFPPPDGHLLVPLTGRKDAVAALDLYPASRKSAIVALRLARAGVALFGPRLLPGRSRVWRPETGEEAIRALADAWSEAIGAWDSLAVLERSQPELAGFSALLMREGEGVAFVKVRTRDGGLETERIALERVEAYDPETFRSPEVLAHGAAGAWAWLAMSAVPIRSRGTVRDLDVDAVVAEIQAALEGWTRPADVPEEWRPMHGDFTPWNVRGAGAGETLLVDWEYAGWGPPEADRVLWHATRAALEDPDRVPGAPASATAFWREVVADRRQGGERDRRLSAGIERALSRMERRRASEVR
ncbi:MAG: phosphotransferase [Gemmatimonadota bacterium]|nr:phosphotransferase [Gemmatimonadota bacterium]